VSTLPSWVRTALGVVRDLILFVFGVVIVMKQAGLYFPAPAGGPEIELIILGGLFCNGPVMLQFLALRFGASGSQGAPGSPAPPLPPSPSSAPSSGASS
jgi:hypothetical protein